MEEQKLWCENLVSSFVDTFVDFCVTDGMFLPPSSPQSQSQSQHQQQLQTYYSSSSSNNDTLNLNKDNKDRLIAVGDLHGDLPKTKESLRMAGLIDSDDSWSGGSSTLVQIGDVLDRGGQELKILYFLEKLKRQALKSGGNVITMNGNHEIMNVDGDFRYVTPSALDEFNNWAYWYSIGDQIKTLHLHQNAHDLFDGIPLSFPRVKREYVQGFRNRIAALRPNGPIATRFLSKNLTVVVVDESVFVHGGILPNHVDYGFQRINQEVSDWINGFNKRVDSNLVRGRNSLVWSRIFSNELPKDCDCSLLQHVLETIPGARRMIMGHTIQSSGINAVCDNTAIRIDVGMSKGCINGLPEVLEITQRSGVRILTSRQLQQIPPIVDSPDILIPLPKQVKVEA